VRLFQVEGSEFMPWRRKQAPKIMSYVAFAAGIVLALCGGILIGYTRWGTTASIVELAEHQLSETQARIAVLEKRLGIVESRLGGANADASMFPNSPVDAPTNRQSKSSDAQKIPEKARP
jgi:hypothetical protein